MLSLSLAIVRKLEKLTNLNKKISFELMTNLKDNKEPSKIANHIAKKNKIKIGKKTKIKFVKDRPGHDKR